MNTCEYDDDYAQELQLWNIEQGRKEKEKRINIAIEIIDFLNSRKHDLSEFEQNFIINKIVNI